MGYELMPALPCAICEKPTPRKPRRGHRLTCSDACYREHVCVGLLLQGGLGRRYWDVSCSSSVSTTSCSCSSSGGSLRTTKPTPPLNNGCSGGTGPLKVTSIASKRRSARRLSPPPIQADRSDPRVADSWRRSSTHLARASKRPSVRASIA
jgi:hypothetical protein